MNTAELVKRTRVKVDDADAKLAVTEDSYIDALTDAQNEFATRTLCLFEETSPISTAKPSPWIAIPAGTIWIPYASFDGTGIKVVTKHELEYGYYDLNGTEATARFSAWRAATGVPKFLVTDFSPLQARLVPGPDPDGSVVLERYRLPAALTLQPEVDPEIPEQFQEALVLGAAAYILDIPDLDAYAAQHAAFLRGMWERKLAQAEIQLQTALRRQDKVIPLPPGSFFRQSLGNTIGAAPSSNTPSDEESA